MNCVIEIIDSQSHNTRNSNICIYLHIYNIIIFLFHLSFYHEFLKNFWFVFRSKSNRCWWIVMLCYLFNFQVFHVDGMLIINLYQIWKHFICLTGLTIEEKKCFWPNDALETTLIFYFLFRTQAGNHLILKLMSSK